MADVYTVGHGNRSIEELVEILRAAGAGRVVDVRRFPGSRRNPHFGKDALARSLGSFGIEYEWREGLGGRRKPATSSRHLALRNKAFQGYADYMDGPEFKQALQELEAEAARPPPLAIMCAETLWWRCHRRLIADALTLAGVGIVHLLDVSKSERHRLHPAGRDDGQGGIVYDVGVLEGL